MKFLLATLTSLTILGLSANAQAPGNCVDGKMVEDDSDTGVSCFVTRSGRTIRLFRTQSANQNVIQFDAREQEICEDGAVMRITPDDMNCISRKDIALSRTRQDRVIRITEQPAQKSGITIIAGGRRHSQ